MGLLSRTFVLEFIVKCTNNNLLFERIMSKRYLQEPPNKKRLKLSNSLKKVSKTENSTTEHSRHNLKLNSVNTGTMHRMSYQNKNFVHNASKIINDECVKTKVEYLDTPNKSESDKKEYRVVKLQNGLTALLISDIHGINALNNDDEAEDEHSIASTSDSESDDDKEGKDDDEDDEDSEEDEEESGNEDDDENEECPSLHKRPKKEEKMAACGLCIGVGSFSDPPEIQGLAHFLEHMVFMGSEKYPEENDFDAFLTKRGGFDNAYTDLETTTFFFDVQEKHLLPALDRFAQFFISPLMKRDAISRERESVDSEFQMALPSDDHRKTEIFNTFAQANHPATKFTWGNLISLRDNISDDKLYEELHKFRERHYSAHRMKLAIQARLPLDALEEIVIQCFSGVPNNGLPPDDFSHFKGENSFEPTRFRKMYKVKPVKDSCEVTLTWVMPPLFHVYKSKPRCIVSWILEHEGKGSLISYLRKKMWCLNITTHNGESGSEHNSTYALFSFSLILTTQGHMNLKNVLDAIFSYINMMRKQGPQKRIYDEIQQIRENAFRFGDEDKPIDYVQDLCDDMHVYPPQDYLTGSELFFEYDPDAIQTVMDALTADNVNIMVLDKKFEEHDVVKTEPWFQTEYSEADIPAEWIENWKTIAPLPEFHLPLPNVYIPNDFSLIPIPPDLLPYPSKVHQDETCEIWYRPDPKFRLPGCYMYLHLTSPIKNLSVHNAALMDLFIKIMQHKLAEELYPAAVADLNGISYATNLGATIQVSGYNQKLPLVLITIVKYMATCADSVTEEFFDVMLKEESKSHYNFFLKASRVEKCVLPSVKALVHWSAIDKHGALTDVSLEDFKHFAKSFTERLYIECLVQGNITQEIAVNTIQECIKTLGCKPLLPNTMPQQRLVQIPLGTNICKVKNFNKKDANSVVKNYYQYGPGSIKSAAVMELIATIMEEPLYNQLRTKEQLGYNVYCYTNDDCSILGFSISVRTQADKYTTEYIDNRIEEFVMSFNKILEDISEKEFNKFKQALIKQKRCVDVQLQEEVNRNWCEITKQEYIFDRPEKEIIAIEQLTIHDLKSWVKDYMMDGRNVRKLSLHVVGNNAAETQVDSVTPDVKSNGKVTYPLEFITNLHYEGEERERNVITDIQEFKNKLYVYPVVRTVL